MLVSRCCYQSGTGCTEMLSLSSVIGRCRSIYCFMLVVRGPFVSFAFVLDKLFVRHLYLLTSVKRLLL